MILRVRSSAWGNSGLSFRLKLCVPILALCAAGCAATMERNGIADPQLADKAVVVAYAERPLLGR